MFVYFYLFGSTTHLRAAYVRIPTNIQPDSAAQHSTPRPETPESQNLGRRVRIRSIARSGFLRPNATPRFLCIRSVARSSTRSFVTFTDVNIYVCWVGCNSLNKREHRNTLQSSLIQSPHLDWAVFGWAGLGWLCRAWAWDWWVFGDERKIKGGFYIPLPFSFPPQVHIPRGESNTTKQDTVTGVLRLPAPPA